MRDSRRCHSVAARLEGASASVLEAENNMKSISRRKTLVLVAVGILSSTAEAKASDVCPAEGATCQIGDPETDKGGEVTMWLNWLENAQQLPGGKWRVKIDTAALAGISVPDGMDFAFVRLTNAQYQAAVDLATNGTTGATTVAVHSDTWVDETETRLMGGFDVKITGPACPYGCQENPWG